ncbi:Z ring-associated protein ZapA [Kingella potus]|uniref:Z ring-associated protein ZapA n=1 Tax=Kingella potus TaxID=265175 RepID=A0A377R137_9NEIS|nr:cell division protein ZapA [Kingella potus]UOP01117.1 cell division protein ZapA [Kingella potus]STR00809.1 Z ring-associated protein ZapA [Kingella potus]
MNDIRQVPVSVMGRTFSIGTPESEQEILLQAVALLNKKTEAVQNGGRIVETDKILIVAALNAIHDLLKISIQDGLAIGDFERRIGDMVQACDKALAKVA